MTALPTQQVAGVYHRRVGDILVTTLHDGYQDVAMTTVLGIDPGRAAQTLHDSFRPVPRRTTVNTFLVRSAGRIALIDAGCGSGGRATVGALPGNLAAAGVDPAAIDTVLMTHLHPDHFGGLVDRDKRPVFPEAELVLHPDEIDYWQDDAPMLRVADPARRQLFFGDARAAIRPYADRTRLIQGTGEVFPGVTPLPLPGHTPGHTGYLIASGGESLLVWGDIVHVQELQVPHPEVTMAVDVDPPRAIKTRRALFDRMAADRQAFAGMHLHFPAMAHLARHGDGHVLVQDAWSSALAGDIPHAGLI